MSQISKAHRKLWFEGPLFGYRVRRKRSTLSVDVTRSSRPIRGLQLNADIDTFCRWYQEKRQDAGARVLDFGAGAWLRYTQSLPQLLAAPEMHFVEYGSAFDGDDASALLATVKATCRHWEPAELVVDDDETRFDLIFVVNVLNAIPEESHRREIFTLLARRLAPLGHLVVLQRVWYQSDSPPGSHAYGEDGWLIPHTGSELYTYHAGTGNNWFNKLGKQKNLRLRQTVVPGTGVPGNTIFKVWERRAL